MNRVAITGIGIIDTLGNNPDDCYESFISDNYNDPIPYHWCRVEEYHNQLVFPITSEVQLPNIHPKTLRTFDDNIKYGIHAVNQALKDSGVKPSSNVAVVASNITAGDEAFFESVNQMVTRGKMTNVKNFLAGMKDYFSGFICHHWGFTGPSIALNAACATSLYNIDYAMRFVDDHDYVVCATSDASINPIAIPFFSGLGALGTKSTPFEEGRDGFIPSDGAACLILESEQKAKARGATIYAYVYPAGMATDIDSSVAPNKNGAGAKNAMKKALGTLNPSEISFVCAHGTSTPIGDAVELQSIKELFGDIDIIAPKTKIGHTMGACGMIEAIYGIKYAKKTGYFVNNSFGFGGKCSSQVIKVKK
jgi:3-oxoacyl-[acyl-carrier-protein] synthase II